ncbi:MAG TPA: T9SS C-terminal target domain-containing protein [Flavobacterium sp.]|jgi:hypothetical protein|nr:T9SS C-terminal target domain-containing protein [Flavobacterium sp.]
MRTTNFMSLLFLLTIGLTSSCGSDGGSGDGNNPPGNPPSSIEWQKAIGGTQSDYGQTVTQTNDGGYIVAGYSQSTNGDVEGHHGPYYFNDIWVVKFNGDGLVQWKKSIGGSGEDRAYAIKQTTDGGYIIVGTANSSDGDVLGGQVTGASGWVVKLTSSGNIDWQKTYDYDGGSNEILYAVVQTSDGGYTVAGYSEHGNGIGASFWILKLNATGVTVWEKFYGGGNDDRAFSLNKCLDGGYIVVGRTSSNDGNVTGNHGDFDWWVIKLSSGGDLEWQKAFGGSGMDEAYAVDQTSDGGYIIGGWTGSADGNVTDYNGNGDFWIVKLNSSGSMVWQKAYGGTSVEKAYAIQQTSDDKYIVAGYASSSDGFVTGNHGSDDFWLVKLDGSGDLIWQKTLGGSGLDQAKSIEQTNNGGYIIAGVTSSDDGDVIGNTDEVNVDYWVVKLTGNN